MDAPPRSLIRVALWMPGGVGLRVANVFGFRFEVSRWDDMGPFVIATSIVGCLLWAAVMFGVVTLVQRLVAGQRRAAA